MNLNHDGYHVGFNILRVTQPNVVGFRVRQLSHEKVCASWLKHAQL